MKMKLESFIDYCLDFYHGDESVYNLPFSESEIVYACYLRSLDKKNYCGDTHDREKVRQYLETGSFKH